MPLRANPSDRIKGALAAIAVQAALGYALVTGLAVEFREAVDESLALFTPIPDQPPLPPEPVVPAKKRDPRPEGAASPPNLRSRATEVAAPPPVVRIVQPAPVVVAPIPSTEADPTSGAADVRGPGTGSGGLGDGTGSGGSGSGSGGGGGGTPPEQIAGRIRDADYPESASIAGEGGTVSVSYAVETNGRATDCRIERSSGSPELDATTCRLIEQRFRFRPALDAEGRPVRSILVEDHHWIIE